MSYTGPKTSRAARDRAEQNPRRIQPSRHRRSITGAAPAAPPPRKISRRQRTTPRQARRAAARKRRAPIAHRHATSAQKESTSSAPTSSHGAQHRVERGYNGRRNFLGQRAASRRLSHDKRARAAGQHATTSGGDVRNPAVLQRPAISREVVPSVAQQQRNDCAGRGQRCATSALGDGFGSGPTGPGPTDEHSVHPHHRDFIITSIADQIGPIDSVSKTEYYDLKNHFSEPQYKMTVLPLNIGKSRFDIDCGSLRQSGPRPDPRLLRQAALEALTRSARTNTHQKTRPEQFPAKWRWRRAAHGGGGKKRGRRRVL
ncbi:hypothetical protein F511_07765 [Dorcoceras hygrometricum]|uniref:Uncharacterized protein n=1 Tax=Dorcoceras hygrometricum TaxID=472368 RepID=A0A2Z7D035_9LAMI|nr:hypothetical protein F511_07765 [Dorcoceras hygrometricum]